MILARYDSGFTRRVCHHGKPVCLHELISIVLVQANQITLKIERCQGYFLKIALETRVLLSLKHYIQLKHTKKISKIRAFSTIHEIY